MTRPLSREILAALAEAGDAGLVVPDLVDLFDEPERRDARTSRVNSVLRNLSAGSYVRQGTVKEPSPHWYRSMCYRWFITPEGIMRTETGRRQPKRQSGRSRLMAAEARRRRLLVQDERREFHQYRLAEMRRLREAGFLLNEISEVFGLSVPQISILLSKEQ